MALAMNLTHDSLKPVYVTRPAEWNAPETRTFQGIPGIEKLPSGRLFATWYTGGNSECCENYAVLAVSDDDGLTWNQIPAVIDPPDPDVRAFDPTLWLAPTGKLYWFWAQGCGGPDSDPACIAKVFDGLAGVWFVIIENPDDPPQTIRFSEPKRISNGVMLNKPTVLRNGEWAFPCSLWSMETPYRDFHKKLDPVYGAMMIVSADQGKTFVHRGTVDILSAGTAPDFDEHQFLQKKDGMIECFIRSIDGIRHSRSEDNGATWTVPAVRETFSVSTRFFVSRLQSGRVLLITNNGGRVRKNLTAFLSEDDGETWPHQLLLDEREGVSYPDCIQDRDGNLYISYDYNRYQGGFLYLTRITEEDILNGKAGGNSFFRREIGRSRPVSKA